MDQRQLRINAAVTAAVVYAFAEMDVTFKRRTRRELDEMFRRHNFEEQLRAFGVWEEWRDGKRGRQGRLGSRRHAAARWKPALQALQCGS